MSFRLATRVTGVAARKNDVEVTLEPAAGGKPETLVTDIVLVSIGRKPYTEGQGLAEAGVETDETGRIRVDRRFATNVSGNPCDRRLHRRSDAGAQGRGRRYRGCREHRGQIRTHQS